MRNWLRWAYKGILLLAAPAVFWTSFEMYGLTLTGPQMLFYSITHAYPTILLVVLLSIPFFLLWGLFNIVSLFSSGFRSTVGVSVLLASVFFAFQVAHVFALFLYDSWSYVTSFRIATCVGYLTFLGVVIVLAAVWALVPDTSLHPTPRTARRG